MDIKTAKQHNAPQVGESKLTGETPESRVPSPQSKVPDSGLKTQDSGLPQRPWTLRDLKDTRQNVREAVEAAAFVPAGAKAMLVEIIDQTFPHSRLLSLDAHQHVFSRGNKQTVDFCLTISEL